MARLTGQRALVTGASSGIGEALARRLAAMGCSLVIAARRKDRLEKLASELRAAHGLAVDVVACDLARSGAAHELFEAASAGGSIDVLVNNAGVGDYQEFLAIDWQKHAAQLQVNVVSLVELTYLCVGAMRKRDGRGYVLNVASMAALLPVPYFSNYAGSKAYVRSFSESLAFELRGTGVTVTCLCPGNVETEFMSHSGQEGNLGRIARSMIMTADRCAAIGLRAMLAGRRTVVSGFGNAATMFVAKFLPRRALTRGSYIVLGAPQPPALPEDAAAGRGTP